MTSLTTLRPVTCCTTSSLLMTDRGIPDVAFLASLDFVLTPVNSSQPDEEAP
jgi:hypothetical protein